MRSIQWRANRLRSASSQSVEAPQVASGVARHALIDAGRWKQHDTWVHFPSSWIRQIFERFACGRMSLLDVGDAATRRRKEIDSTTPGHLNLVPVMHQILAGFTSAVLGIKQPLAEPAIVASIVVLGLLIGLAVKTPVWLGALIVGSFALFHGHAHGTEAATAGASLASYATGFSLATAALHIVGIGAGLMLARSTGTSGLRTTGVFVAVGGLLVATAT